MSIRPFRTQDADALAALSAHCARTEADFVLNPQWQAADDLFAEFERQGADPTQHLLVADAAGEVVGLAGFLRRPPASAAGLLCPIVARDERGRGLGGELLRAALAHGGEALGIKFATAGVGTRNHAGYALLTSHGFRPVRQHFLLRCDQKPKLARAPLSGLEVGAAKPEDAEVILELYHACGFEARTLERMREVLSDGRHEHALARLEGEPVAFAEIDTFWPRRVWVSFVGVAGGLRAKGVGSAVAAWALARRFEAGTESALLLLNPANREALRAYEKVGFRRHRVVDVLEKGL